MHRLRYLLVFMMALFIYNISWAQKMYVSPQEDIVGDDASVRILGNWNNMTACFLDGYEGYKVLWYDSIMRKWGESSLDFLYKGAERIQATYGKSGVQVYYQVKERRQRILYAAMVLPIHKDSIRPVAIDSFKLRTSGDKSFFEYYNTNTKNTLAYGQSSFDYQAKEYTFMVKTYDASTTIGNSLNGKFTAKAYHRILYVHQGKKQKISALLAEITSTANTYKAIRMANGLGSKLNYSKLDLATSINAPTFYYRQAANALLLGALSSNNDLWQVSYDPSLAAWSSPLVTNQVSLPEANSLANVRLRGYIPKRTGGGVFLLERSFEEVQTRGRSMVMMPSGAIFGGGTYEYSVYHSRDIVAVSTNAMGEYEWQQKIEKSQESSIANDPLHSFSYLSYPTGHVLTFVDESMGEKKLTMAFLSKDGQLHQRQFASSAYPELERDRLLIQSAKQVAADAIILPVLKRNEASFIKIKF